MPYPRFSYGSQCGQGGKKRLEGSSKSSDRKKPLISVVTVVFNGKKYLEETIKSVISQTYENIEYLIVDGGSTDGTLDIIKKYEGHIDYWISEPDKGVYDAMNKGIQLATGEWINFMNAGDTFCEISTISDIFDTLDCSGYTILYGDCIVQYPGFERMKRAGELNALNKGMQFSHQSMFINTEFHKLNQYDLRYRLAADFKLVYSAYISKASFFYLSQRVSKVINGGLADTNRSIVFQEYLDIISEINPSLKNTMYYRFLMVLDTFKSILKLVLPGRLIAWIQKIK